MKSEVTWEDVRKILDVLEIDEAARVTEINIGGDELRVESVVGFGRCEETRYITGDRKALEREPVRVEVTTLSDAEPVYKFVCDTGTFPPGNLATGGQVKPFVNDRLTDPADLASQSVEEMKAAGVDAGTALDEMGRRVAEAVKSVSKRSNMTAKF